MRMRISLLGTKALKLRKADPISWASLDLELQPSQDNTPDDSRMTNDQLTFCHMLLSEYTCPIFTVTVVFTNGITSIGIPRHLLYIIQCCSVTVKHL